MRKRRSGSTRRVAGRRARPSRIRVRNEHRSCRIDERLLARFAGEILQILGRDAELEFLFLDDRAIRRLNKAFKRRDRATDVLSFRIDYDGPAGGGRLCIGQIAISLDTARRNCRRFVTPFADEIVRYVIHGILHFFGYRDGSAAERRRMSRKETAVLETLCTNEDLSKVLMPR